MHLLSQKNLKINLELKQGFYSKIWSLPPHFLTSVYIKYLQPILRVIVRKEYIVAEGLLSFCISIFRNQHNFVNKFLIFKLKIEKKIQTESQMLKK